MIDIDTGLESCPFCGGLAKLDSKYHQVSCGNPLCDVRPQTWLCDTDEEAIADWNRREQQIIYCKDCVRKCRFYDTQGDYGYCRYGKDEYGRLNPQRRDS